ncbi:unnamed protein product [Rhizophagus irregularis]|nr:unnamed protein product [Rhizophagus irregularis]
MSLSIVYHLCFYFLVIWRNFTLTQRKENYILNISYKRAKQQEYLKRDQQLRDEPLEATVPMINIVFDNV